MAQDQLFASFLLDRDTGLEIALRADSVIEATPLPSGIKPLPGGVEFLEGIMQHREKVVPVVNLKKRFGFKESGYGPEAKIAVVSLLDQPLGLMVDDICEVFRAEPEAVTPVSPMLQSGDKLISAVIQLGRGHRTAELLDLDNIFSIEMKEAEVTASIASTQVVSRKPISWSRFVVFRCGCQEFGVPVEYAQETTFLTEIDEMFRSGMLEGALNLRGRTVPVISASRLLAVHQEGGVGCREDSRILVLASEGCCFGLIVEEVREILKADADEILRLPQGQEGNLLGIYQRPTGENVLLLNMPALVCDQMEDLKSMARLKNDVGVETAQTRQSMVTTRHLITENCYLIFSIDKKFAIEIKDVREIIESGNVMSIPGSSGYRSGLINLRGEIVPVINLRRFYGFAEKDGKSTRSDRLIICQAHGRTVALEVDTIVTIYKQEQYHATPSLHPKMRARKDTLDRLIEFSGADSTTEHVLVVNVYNLIRNHLEITVAGEEND